MDKQIKERGIIFNGEMVGAILDGSKTQTRRVVKLQPESNQHGICIVTESGIKSEEGKFFWSEFNATGHKTRSPLFSCPFGKVGDRLWVREAWSDVNYEGSTALAYRADGELKILNEDDGDDSDPNFEKYQFANWYPDLIEGTEGRWRPSIHMPRWASRITLEITDIRVERLQDISEEDAKSEGAPTECCVIGDKHFLGFRSLWKSIYGQDSWQSNPFVWVVRFKRVCQ